MTFDGWLTSAVVVGAVAAMARGVASDLALSTALLFVLALGVVQPADALAGFANEGLLTVAALFVVAAGVDRTRALDASARAILGRPRTPAAAVLRMGAPVAGMSAFLNNTPVVAMMIPVVSDWARRIGIPPSRLLIPLSYATILGGCLTLVGTSTNLVVAGMARAHDGGLSFGVFGITGLGAGVLVTGLAYVALRAHALPDRGAARPLLTSAREYTVQLRVEPGAAVAGRTIDQAGLRGLPGLYLVEVDRGDEVLTAVGPDVRLEVGDTLRFVGVVDSVVDVMAIRGLSAVRDDSDAPLSPTGRNLFEAVIARRSWLVGRGVRELGFRTRFSASILAVQRDGERVAGKIGDVVLRAGDALLVEARPGFLGDERLRGAFALAAEVEGYRPPRHDRAAVALSLLVAMVAASTLGGASLLQAALLCAGAMLLTRCMTGEDARRALDLPVLVSIGAALGLGRALEVSGVASAIGEQAVGLTAPAGTVGLYLGIYATTAVLTELVTNNAAAALVFPIAISAAELAGADPYAVSYLVMLAASASFATPIGYQTNLMVCAAGSYRFSDFVRFGAPLQVLLLAVSVTLVTVGEGWLY